MRMTFSFASAAATATWTASVVFPLPPFWLRNPMERMGLLCLGICIDAKMFAFKDASMLPRREGVVNRHFQIGPDGALGYRFGGGDLGQMSNYTALTALEAHTGD